MSDHESTDDDVRADAGPTAPFADRANGQPAILRGMTQSEVTLVALVAFPGWAVLGLLLGLVTRVWALAALVGAVGPMLTVWMLAGWLASKKLNRPDGYYVHQFKAWKAKAFGKKLFITHAGHWSLGRSLEIKSLPAKTPKKAAGQARSKSSGKTASKGAKVPQLGPAQPVAKALASNATTHARSHS